MSVHIPAHTHFIMRQSIIITNKLYCKIGTPSNNKPLFPGGSNGKESASNVEELGSITGSGRSPGEGNGNPLQYF